jgi:hypothetical protein
MNHTPGPWTVVADDTVYAFPPSTDPKAIAAGYANDAQLIAEVSVAEDARLIAAAPDLLEAMEAVSDEWDAYIGSGDTEGHDDPVLVGEKVADLRAAIAKAKGES